MHVEYLLCTLHILEDMCSSYFRRYKQEQVMQCPQGTLGRRHILKNGNDQRQITFNNKYIPPYSTFFSYI